MSQMKSSPLGKDEVLMLLDLILKTKIITTKATNATNNKLKEDAWKSIAKDFSATTGEMRRPEQLRLKWENMKKAARKCSAMICQNNLKTGGGKMFIPPDEALDRVASMLGATCTGFSDEFGGDVHILGVGEHLEHRPLPELPHTVAEDFIFLSGGGLNSECTDGGGDNCGNDGGSGNITHTALEAKLKPKQLIFKTPQSSIIKRRKLTEVQIAQRDKEMAMAAYFRAKTEKVELENIKLRLEIEQLKKGS